MKLHCSILTVMVLACVTGHAKDSPPVDGGDRGQALYIAKCAKCHEFYKPTDYSDTDWTKWMQKMKKKSKLNAMDYEAVLSYSQKLRGK